MTENMMIENAMQENTMQENAMIEFRNISKSYDGVSVITDLNLTIAKGEFCVLIRSEERRVGKEC